MFGNRKGRTLKLRNGNIDKARRYDDESTTATLPPVTSALVNAHPVEYTGVQFGVSATSGSLLILVPTWNLTSDAYVCSCERGAGKRNHEMERRAEIVHA